MKRSLTSQQHMTQSRFTNMENISTTQTTVISKVFKTDSSDRTPLAMKRMNLKQEDTTIPPYIIRELAITSELNSPHIVHPAVNDISYEPKDRTISYVYEYGAADVKRVMSTKKVPLKETTIKSILFQILLGLDYMHSRGISHCNVTPSNLLIMPTTSQTPGILRFIDFSLARVAEPVQKLKPLNSIYLGYRAPEIVLGQSDYSYPSDIWSAGCIFAELLTGTLFDVQKINPQDQIQVMLRKYFEVIGSMSQDDFPRHEKYTNWMTFQQMLSSNQLQMRNSKGQLYQKVASLNPEIQDLLFKMLTYNPDLRITAKDALRHPYFNSRPFPVMNIARTFTPEEWSAISSGNNKE
ncbi:CMGC family protein kinase [Trichomonas vaginalis G3]|uniref:CMGC family protein kinase n=2 Tax=Trichomonas vaginalis (strain ATCC PRA-98 / G3) TaxID=412133 RepID=A2DHR9_TRIV3|nr:CMGC family protein kinase [Trichomonas vaginalis G3]|eukprot:XP_001581103.1 CMGC family protein kinase [Trichomonas vaginalis G3]